MTEEGEEAKYLRYFIGGVSSEISKDLLRQFLSNFGVVKQITDFNAISRKKLYGFRFVKFERVFNEQLLSKAISFEILNRKIQMVPVLKKSELKKLRSEKSRRGISLHGVPSSMPLEDLRRFVSSYGTISKCYFKLPDQYNEGSNNTRICIIYFQVAEVARSLKGIGCLQLTGNIICQITEVGKESRSTRRSLEYDKDLRAGFAQRHMELGGASTAPPRLNLEMLTTSIQLGASEPLECKDYSVKPTSRKYYTTDIDLNPHRRLYDSGLFRYNVSIKVPYAPPNHPRFLR